MLLGYARAPSGSRPPARCRDLLGNMLLGYARAPSGSRPPARCRDLLGNMLLGYARAPSGSREKSFSLSGSSSGVFVFSTVSFYTMLIG